MVGGRQHAGELLQPGVCDPLVVDVGKDPALLHRIDLEDAVVVRKDLEYLRPGAIIWTQHQIASGKRQTAKDGRR